jgi:hypothetical protein
VLHPKPLSFSTKSLAKALEIFWIEKGFGCNFVDLPKLRFLDDPEPRDHAHRFRLLGQTGSERASEGGHAMGANAGAGKSGRCDLRVNEYTA